MKSACGSSCGGLRWGPLSTGRRRGLLDEAAQDVEGIRAREQAQHDDQEEASASELESPRRPSACPRRSSTLSLRRMSLQRIGNLPGGRLSSAVANSSMRQGVAAPQPAVARRGSRAPRRRRPSLQATGWSSKIAAVPIATHVEPRPSRLRHRARALTALLPPGAAGPRPAGRRARGAALQARRGHRSPGGSARRLLRHQAGPGGGEGERRSDRRRRRRHGRAASRRSARARCSGRWRSSRTPPAPRRSWPRPS